MLQANAEQAVRELLRDFSKSQNLKEVDTVSAEEHMDDGTPIRLAVTIDRRDGSALLDFEGVLCVMRTLRSLVLCMLCMLCCLIEGAGHAGLLLTVLGMFRSGSCTEHSYLACMKKMVGMCACSPQACLMRACMRACCTSCRLSLFQCHGKSQSHTNTFSVFVGCLAEFYPVSASHCMTCQSNT